MKKLSFVLVLLALASVLFGQVLMNEGFEGNEFPAGWQIHNAGQGNNWEVTEVGGNPGATMRYRYNTAHAANAWAFSAPLELAAGTLYFISFDQRTASSFFTENLKVTIGAGATVAHQTTVLFDETGLANNNWVLREFTFVPETSGTYHIGFHCYSVADMFDLFVDNVKVESLLDNDLLAQSITGNTMPTVNIEANYTISVLNYGSVIADAYTVNLMQVVDGADDLVLGTATGANLAAGETAEHVIAWTPENIGDFELYGQVIYTADENPDNNTTNTINVVVQSSGMAVAYIGNPASVNASNTLPLNYYFKNNVSQSLYFEEELQIGGIIESIAYRFNGLGDIPANTQVSFYMAITDREEFASTSDWVSFDEFELVFSGSIPVTESGSYDVVIPLQNPFAYGGGTLVIMAHRHMDENFYGMNNTFQVTNYPESNRTLNIQADATVYDLENLPAAWSINQAIPNTTLIFNTAGLGSVSGVVTHNNQPLANVHINVTGINRNTTTNENGEYALNFISEGNVTITATKHGYVTFTSPEISVVEDQNTEYNFSMNQLPTVNVSGSVIASDTNAAIEGASVRLTGYENYEGISTNAQGEFTIEGVYSGYTYTLTISSEGYQSYTDPFIEVGTTNLVIDTITLLEAANPARNVVATVTDEEANIVWNRPSTQTEVEFRYDSGVVEGQLGVPDGNENIVLGAAHRNDAIVNSVSWYLTSEGGPHNTVKIWVLGLNAQGTPDINNILFSQSGVPNIDDQWNTLELPTPVEAPNGFFIGVSYNGFVAIAMDNGNDPDYPFNTNTQYATLDITSEAFEALETLGNFSGNFLVRAMGIDNGSLRNTVFANSVNPKEVSKVSVANNFVYSSTETPVYTSNNILSGQRSYSRAVEGYRLYRSTLADINNVNQWTSIAILNSQTDTTYTDVSWADVNTGEYKYIVVTVYTNDNLSNPAFSNTVAKDMSAIVNINITTEDNASVNGAVVTLTNNNGNPAYVYTQTATSNVVTFDDVWLGTYSVRVQLMGYQTVISENVNINTNPFNYSVELSLSNVVFEDDFESYPDFALEFGQWTLIDLDGSPTYVLGGITFPNSGSPMAYIVFNPSQTSPALEYDAYSGQKMAACFAAENAPNNDWMITPQFGATANSTISFWARSFTAQYGLERFKVAVGTTPNPAQMTVITPGAYVETPVEWTEFTYSLADYAGQDIYVAIVCVSDDAFIFFVDDVQIEGTTSINENISTPMTTKLNSNYPNPFNPSTMISFDNAKEGNVKIDIFNVKGQRVKTLVNDHFTAGTHSIEWNGTDDNGKNVSSGVYFYNMRSGKYSATRKMLLMK